MGGSRRFRKLVSITMVLMMVFSFFSTSVFAAQKTDISGHWAEKEINEWVEKGLIGGYSDGSFKPNAAITRAEFIALVNRAFGFDESSEGGFTDIFPSDWYYSEILKAKAAGYIGGYEDGSIKPNNNISRQEVAAILARLASVESNASSVDQFNDKDNIPAWSRGVVGGVVDAGFMRGYEDGTFKPFHNTTRAEAVVILNRALKDTQKPSEQEKVYDTAGVYGPEEGLETVAGNVKVTASGVTLRNMVIEGDLTISEEVGNGDAFLKGVTVKGKTYVNGGGENSIHFEDTVLITVIVNKEDGTVRIVATGKTSVQEVILHSSAKVEQDGTEGIAFKEVTLGENLPANSKVTLIGNFESVNILATTFAVEIPKGSIQEMNVAENATDANITVAEDAKIVSLILDSVVKVIGQGTIEKAEGKAANDSTYEKKPNNMAILPSGGGGGGGGSSSSDEKDTTPPTILSYSPVPGAENVALTRDLVITFSEDVVAVPEKFIRINLLVNVGDEIFTLADEDEDGDENENLVLATIPVTDKNIKVTGSVVTIDLWNILQNINDDEADDEPVILAMDTENSSEDSLDVAISGVYIEIDEGAFKDKAGNEFEGIYGPEVWSFSWIIPDASNPDLNPFEILEPIEVISAFGDDGDIPFEYSRYGENYRLPVSWSKIEGAKSYIVLLIDQNAGYDIDSEDDFEDDSEIEPVLFPFVHWYVKDIPSDVSSIGEENLAGIELMNGFGEIGYGGPQPPIGETHTYQLIVAALEVDELVIDDEHPLFALEEAFIKGQIIGYGELEGSFGIDVDPTASEVPTTADTIQVEVPYTFEVTVRDTTDEHNPLRRLHENDFSLKINGSADNEYLNIETIEETNNPGVYEITIRYSEVEEILINVIVGGVDIGSFSLIVTPGET
ncbi:S-layer homology domain-containing protein [Calidifontibacillus erzurumensis]|uniref:S-layer homology domain-containing protein n=1 Tax=Calidifontibacillus erzurumensis TaxID=2741433 RepID=UPI0035B53441